MQQRDLLDGKTRIQAETKLCVRSEYTCVSRVLYLHARSMHRTAGRSVL